MRASVSGKAIEFTHLFHHSTFIYWAHVISQVLWEVDGMELGGAVYTVKMELGFQKSCLKINLHGWKQGSQTNKLLLYPKLKCSENNFQVLHLVSECQLFKWRKSAPVTAHVKKKV